MEQKDIEDIDELMNKADKGLLNQIIDNFKSFLWSLESKGIYGKNYGIMSDKEFAELTKIVNMFLKLSYWI